MGHPPSVVIARHSHRQHPSPSSAQIVRSRGGQLKGASFSSKAKAKAKA
jgi:hypothetical protein